MKEKYIVFAGFLSLIIVIMKYGCYMNLYSDQARELRKRLDFYVLEKYGVNKASMEFLADMTGVPQDTVRNYLYGRTPINREFLLYLIFGLGMNKSEAFDLLGFFGYNENVFKYLPYKEFYSLIGTNPDMSKRTVKEFVDDIIDKATDDFFYHLN